MTPNKPRFVGECQRVKLSDICSKGKSSLRQKDVFNDGPYAVYGASGIVGTMGEYQNEAPYVAVVKDGAGVGRANACEAKTSVLGTMQALLPNSNVERDYLLHLVRSLHLGEGFSGSTIPHIYFKDYGKLDVPLPSVDVQKQIVSQFNAIEQQIAQAEAQVEKLDRLVKSRFVEILNDAVIPKTDFALGDIVSIRLGLTHTPTYTDRGKPFLSVKDISSGAISFDKCKYISEAEFDSLPIGARPSVGDLLFCRVGTMGKPVIIEEGTPEFGAFVSLGHFKLGPKVNIQYLKAWMESGLFNVQVQKYVTGASQPNLNTGWLKQFVVPLPPLEQQEIFAKCVSQVDKPRFVRYKRNQSFAPLRLVGNLS